MRMLLGAALVLAGSAAVAEEPKQELPKPLPAAVAKAWKDAGATVGWMTVDQLGYPQYQDKAVAGAVPAFQFREWKAGVVAKLPNPDAPFGLDLGLTPVTDAGLKELVPLKHLATLDLGRTSVTDAGLKHLAPLKNLTELHLIGTKVTDAGLKDLASLKNLTALHLLGTPVTDAGVRELRKALPKCQITR